MMTRSRLDLLIYAHDGRGLGHVSRSIGVGTAVRRLFPKMKVLLVSGSSMCADLIGPAPLDFLKLPAYATRIVDGRSRGMDGPSGFTDQDLGQLRAGMLKDLVTLYRPRLVLCDHSPLGKHRELLPALEAGRQSRWILGVRGVVGAVPQVFSERAGEVFKEFFSDLFWYGDTRVLGTEPLEELEQCFGHRAVCCGYVSRLAELARFSNPELSATDGPWAGTIAVPRQGDPLILKRISEALAGIGPSYGRWKIFLHQEGEQKERENNPFSHLSYVSIEPPGRRYSEFLLSSRSALIYGGYNSLADVLSLRIPALVLRRALQDREQDLHLERLCTATGNLLLSLPEETVTGRELEQGLRSRLECIPASYRINLDGAATAARTLAGMPC